MFETADLSDVAYLVSHGFPATPARLHGSLVSFRVDISEAEALKILMSPERARIRRYHADFRRLRRDADHYLMRAESAA